jgi:hypothetical protein
MQTYLTFEVIWCDHLTESCVDQSNILSSQARYGCFSRRSTRVGIGISTMPLSATVSSHI